MEHSSSSNNLDDRQMAAAGIPTRYRDKGLEGYAIEHEGQRKALSAARAFIEDGRIRSLVLLGLPGTGKTHIAAGIARELIAAGGWVLYLSAADLSARLRECSRSGGPRSERQEVACLTDPGLLIIDDVGAAGSDPIAVQRAIDVRYADAGRMVIASNLDPDGLAAYLGERAVDRLREGGRVIVFDWSSHRAA